MDKATYLKLLMEYTKLSLDYAEKEEKAYSSHGSKMYMDELNNIRSNIETIGKMLKSLESDLL